MSASKPTVTPSVTQKPKFIGAVEDEWQLYSDLSDDYTVGLPIGFGASSIVYAAVYQPQPDPKSSAKPPSPIPVALKVVNLEKLPTHSLALLQRETILMSLSKHPNVLRVRGSWMDGHKLYIAMRLMNRGSAADIMRYGWPGGMEEDVIRCILSQGLEGLNYLHVNGFIHRDIKAANFLIDDDGTVLLGDLGVAADLADDNSQAGRHSLIRPHAISAASAVSESQGAHARPPPSRESSSGSSGKHIVLVDSPVPSRPALIKRKSFVGTPCWMAPELIQGKQYDSSADIWSFGITALELAQGRPPRSRESHKKVLLKTIQEDPPTLDREGGTYKYSRAFQEMVAKCLVKDPSKRPTAEELLQLPFFKNAKKKSYLVNTVLKDLPPLTTRQERQALHNTLVHPSVASWDFTLHARSPSSLFKRSRPPSLAGVDADLPEDESFDLDSPISARHSRSISWAVSGEDHPVGKTLSHPPTMESQQEVEDANVSAELSASESDLPSDENTTPPTSEGGVPDMPSSSSSKPRPPEGEISSPVSHSHSTPVAIPRSVAQDPPLPIQSTPSSLSSNASKLSGSPGQSGSLWSKLKIKTKSSFRKDEGLAEGKLARKASSRR